MADELKEEIGKDTKTQTPLYISILGAAAIVAGGIFVGKPATELPQFENAVIIETADAKIIPAHIDTIRKDVAEIKGKDTTFKSVVDKTISVPETIERPQQAQTIDSCFRSGDVYRKAIYRNDSLISDVKVLIADETYPKNGHVLKAYEYTQWVESLNK